MYLSDAFHFKIIRMKIFSLTSGRRRKLVAFFAVVFCLIVKTESGFGQIIQVTGSPQTATTGGTTLTITKPSGLAVNDVMIANIMQSGNSSTDLNDATSTGWIKIAGNNL